MNASRHQIQIALRGLAAVAIALGLALAVQPATPPARAAIFIVNSATDAADLTPGDGSCATAGAVCTLRAAIEEANALAGADVIQVPTGTYTLDPLAAPAVLGQLNVTTDVTIEPTTITATVTIDGSGLVGASIFGITDAAGILRLTNLTIANQAAGHPAIEVLTGTVTISGSTLSGNAGGAVRLNGAATTAQISTSTISGNSSVNGTAGVLVAVAGGSATLDHVTVAGNTTSGGSGTGGVFATAGATLTIQDSILATNIGPDSNDCYGTITAANANIVATTGPNCTVTGTTPLTASPALGALGSNGGQTSTQLPASNSPAINAALGACTGTDQRGVSRPRGAACDLGAVELPVVTFNPLTYTPADAAGNQAITANLDAAVPFAQSVTYTLANGTALSGTDYSGSGGTFSFAANATSANSNVAILRNTAITGNRNFTATFGTTTAVAGNGPATLTIQDADAPVVAWSNPSGYTVAENAGTLTITATLSAPDVQAVFVTFDTISGTARAGTEYVPISSGTITVTAGASTGTASVTINDNNWDASANKSFIVRITGVSHGTFPVTDSTVTINDNEATPSASLTTSAVTVSETAATAPMTITVPYTSEVDIDVSFATANGTAEAGSDYTAITSTTTITNGTTSRVVSVGLIDNSYYSGNQAFTFSLTGQTPGSLGATTLTTLTLTDSEAVPTVTLGTPAAQTEGNTPVAIAASISYLSEVPIVVNYTTQDGTAVAGSDYTAATSSVTIPARATSATISVNLRENTYYSGQQAFTVRITSQSPGPANTNSTTVTINDNDNPPSAAFTSSSYSGGENTGAIGLPVVLDRTAEMTITVTYSLSGDSAIEGRDYTGNGGTLEFAPGAITATVGISVLDNAFYSGSRSLSAQLGTQNIGSVGSQNNASATITDNEAIPAARIETPSGGGYTVSELSGSAVVTITLPYTSTSAINVNYATANDTAIAGSDYVTTTGNLSIPTGQISGTVSIPILNNLVFTGDRYFSFQLSGQSPGTLGSPASAQVTIIDAQQQPAVQFAVVSFNVARDVGTAPITVTLSTVPGINVTVPYTMANGTALAGVDYVLSTGILTFTPGTTSQVINVPILDSGHYVGDRFFSMGLGTPVGATLGDNRVATVLIRETNAFRLYLPQIRKLYDSRHEYEPNESRTSANGPLVSGWTYRGGYNADQVDAYGLDRDTWYFRADGPGQVVVTVTSQDPGRQVKLLNSNGIDIPGGFSGDPAPTTTFTVSISAAGTYYVRIYNSSQLGTNEYQLTVTHP